MVKYRLIKQYPGSPKINTEATQLSDDSIECYPEFWEKVEDKDYEILSYEDNFGNVFSKKGDLFTNDKLTYGPQYCLEYFKIYSIKRLSDGEVFTVGDKIDFVQWEKEISKISLDERDSKNTHSRVVPYLECGKDFGDCYRDWETVTYRDWETDRKSVV